jgi:hypothetical protein
MKVLASPKSLLPRFKVTLEFVSGVSLCEVFFLFGRGVGFAASGVGLRNRSSLTMLSAVMR